MPIGTSSVAVQGAPTMPRRRSGADLRPRKLDLSIAAYRDELGETPIFDAVKRAESQLLLSQRSKSYIGCEGEQEFVALLGAEAFATQRHIGGLQTVGGTGALRLAGELLGLFQRLASHTQSRQVGSICPPTVIRLFVNDEVLHAFPDSVSFNLMRERRRREIS